VLVEVSNWNPPGGKGAAAAFHAAIITLVIVAAADAEKIGSVSECNTPVSCEPSPVGVR
jgi:hypothetical protein